MKASKKRRISLRWFVALAFLSLGILLVVGYTLLSLNYFINGMDNAMGRNMDKVAQSYLTDPVMAAQLFEEYPVTSQWSEQPQVIQRAFARPPEREGILYKQLEQPNVMARPSAIYFATRFTTPGGDRFLSHQMIPGEAPRLMTEHRGSLQTLLLISLACALSLGLLIWLVMQRVSRPVSALGRWAHKLNEQTLSQPPPDFSYPELNEFAELVRSSLSTAQRGLEREHRFLRHTSHELRTPISVVRNNVELLNRLQESSDQQVDLRQLQAIERIDRASQSMLHLTETLLWLSRDNMDNLPASPVQLDNLVRELVEQMRYLLRGKDVDVQVKTDPYSMKLAEAPARIVLGNLIRNAFQHSSEGEVKILQLHNCVRISNTLSSNEQSPGKDLGAGLGLQLTTQLTTKLGWRYHNQQKQHRQLAELWLQPPHADAAARRG
jgi:signal transduction histidine kinase